MPDGTIVPYKKQAAGANPYRSLCLPLPIQPSHFFFGINYKVLITKILQKFVRDLRKQ